MINNGKGFYRVGLLRIHPNRGHIFAIFKAPLHLYLTWHRSENSAIFNERNVLSSSEFHVAVAKSFEIVGHVNKPAVARGLFTNQMKENLTELLLKPGTAENPGTIITL